MVHARLFPVGRVASTTIFSFDILIVTSSLVSLTSIPVTFTTWRIAAPPFTNLLIWKDEHEVAAIKNEIRKDTGGEGDLRERDENEKSEAEKRVTAADALPENFN